MNRSHTMIDAYRAGIPDNGKPFPDGSKIGEDRKERGEEPSMQTITTIGLDIAKSVFQVHGIDAEGKVVIRAVS